MASIESAPLTRLLLANESRLGLGMNYEVAAAGDFFESRA